MCDNPNCDKEIKQCEILAESFSKALAANGRCTYHESITIGISGLRGSLKILLWAIGIGSSVIFSMQAANLWFLFSHIVSAKGIG